MNLYASKKSLSGMCEILDYDDNCVLLTWQMVKVTCQNKRSKILCMEEISGSSFRLERQMNLTPDLKPFLYQSDSKIM